MTAMHWKLQRDPYLAPLVARCGEQAAFDAGFFFDADPAHEPLDDVDWLCTPLPRLASGAAPGFAVAPGGAARRPVVLLATGAFCPVHDGHLEMMERARRAATEAGLDVLGGYLSPGHDAYVAMKCGPSALPAAERLARCAEAIAGRGWLSVDPWEALHRRVAVNFTDVAARLRNYLRHHVDDRIEVAYVCGGDNARFALAFTQEGGCIVVDRPGFRDTFEGWRQRLANHPDIRFAAGDHPGASRTLPVEMRTGAAIARRRIVVRLEDARAVETLGLGAAAYDGFTAALCELLAGHAAVRVTRVSDAPVAGDGVITLDPLLPAAHRLALSRVYALGGYDLLGHDARPGAEPLERQIARIPPGRYRLVDDDRVSGGTIAAVRRLLPPSVEVAGCRFATAHGEDEEVLDARDFLPGADEGGLVVALPRGRLGRAPYLLPYVDPAARASIVASRDFSRAAWMLAARAFASTTLRVCDLPAPAREVLGSFGDAERLETVCAWHAERLRG